MWPLCAGLYVDRCNSDVYLHTHSLCVTWFYIAPTVACMIVYDSSEVGR